MQDYKPKASPEMYAEFMKTVIFHDFQEELKVRIEDLRDLLEMPESELSRSHESIRGATLCIRQMFNVFNDLKQNAEEDQLRKDES